MLFRGNCILILIAVDIEQCPEFGGSPFLGGFKYTYSMVNSIGALMIVRFMEVVGFTVVMVIPPQKIHMKFYAHE